MSTENYFDDPDQGLARETSHPRFRTLAQDDFYYDCGDDFSPFGNDDGSDTLDLLEQLYQEGGTSDEVPGFIADLIEGWNLGIPPNMIEADEPAIAEWFAQDDMHDRYLHAVCNAHVATAFGQLKITGEVYPEIRAGALAALACQVRINHLARTMYPGWAHAGMNLERLLSMRQVMEAA